MDKPAGQTWLPVPGWDDLYEVSDQGLIWSCRRRRGTAGGILKTPIDNRGYQQVNLCRDGKPVHAHVHMLVATAFHGPRPPGYECRHLDGDRANNVATNLAWGTPSENNNDCVRHGTHYTKYRNATHCIHGHEFTPENTGLRSNGNRFCIACKKRRDKERSARRLAARAAARDAEAS